MALSADDAQMFVAEIARFAQEKVLPATERYDQPMPASQLNDLAKQLVEMGVLPDFSDEPMGLWADMQEAGSTAFSLNLLQALGHANAALALTLHRQALTAYALHQLGLKAEVADTALVLTGHYGLARESLGKYLANKPLTDDDSAMLQDWLDRTRDSLLLATAENDAPHFKQLLWPVWDKNSIQWQLLKPAQLKFWAEPSHGLDELTACQVKQADNTKPTTSKLKPEQAIQLYQQLYKAELLGLTAIATGVLERSSALAIDYSRLRRQGGVAIEQHAAVQIMLSEIRSTLSQAKRLLAGFTQSLDDTALFDIASMRFMLCEQLVHGCHQVIQIHGGIGYMQDTGPEKFMREQNMLRLQSGGVAGLAMLIHGGEQ